MARLTTCPICGRESVESLCPNCGWEIRLFPEDCPKSILDHEKLRISIARKVWKGNCDKIDAESRANQLQAEVQSLYQDLVGGKKAAEAAKLELSKKNSENESLKNELQVKQNALESEKRAHTQTIRRVEELQRELEKTRVAVNTFPVSSVRPRAFLSVKQDMVEDQIFALYPGENTFVRIRSKKGNTFDGRQSIRFTSIGCPDFVFVIVVGDDGTISINDISGHVTMIRGIKNKSLSQGSSFRIDGTEALCTLSIPNA